MNGYFFGGEREKGKVGFLGWLRRINKGYISVRIYFCTFVV